MTLTLGSQQDKRHLYFSLLVCFLTAVTDLWFRLWLPQSIPSQAFDCPDAADPSCSSPPVHLPGAGAGVCVCTAEKREAKGERAGKSRNRVVLPSN